MSGLKNMENNKINCTKCNVIKNTDEFESGRRQCKLCRSKSHKAWYKENRESRLAYNSEYRKNNIEGIKVREKEYENNRRELRTEYKRKYYAENREKIAEHKKQYAKKNKNKLASAQRKYRENVSNRIAGNIRSRVRYAIREKHIRKPGSAIKELGCTTDQLVLYLELQFQEGMTWDNYGEWHIDHIKPLASFNLSDIDEFKQACHYTNLQPLWAVDNFKKGSR